MTKIQITKAQEKALERFKELRRSLNDFLNERSDWRNTFLPIREFTPDEFARLMYEPNSYEVINPITVGSYVRSKMTGSIYKVKAFVNGGKQAELEGIICEVGYVFADRIFTNQLELLTKEEVKEAKEKHFWNKLGREVNELREGDVFYTEMGNIYRIVSDDERECETTLKMSNAKKWLRPSLPEGARVCGFYPVEKMVDMKDLWK